MRATTGLTKVRPDSSASPPPPLVAAGAGAGAAGSVVRGASGGAGAAACSAAGAGSAGASAPPPPPSPVSITAIRVFTGTVWPSSARISRTTPDAGEGTSVSTLSVEISTMISSASIRSPTDFVQRVMVPSDTLTPIWGITTSTTVPVAMGGGS